MRILERYVTGSFLSALLLGWLVLTFVLAVGLLVKVTGLIVRGLPIELVGRYLLAGIPETFGLTIPLAVLTGALLVFGRLSADSEVAAMRACGVDLLRIMAWPLLVGALLSGFCFYVNNEITPPSHETRRRLTVSAGVGVGLDMLEPGRFIEDFRNMKVWFESRSGNWLSNVIIFDSSQPGLTREIRAERARVEARGDDIVVDLQHVRVDPFQADRPGFATADRLTHVIPDALKVRKYEPKTKDLRLVPLLQAMGRIRAGTSGLPPEATGGALSEMRFEFHRRLASACAPFCFVLIGVPLGIRAQRRESTIGVAIALVVSFGFHVVQILAEAICRQPMTQSHVIVWIPVAACLVIGLVLIPRNR
jgi:lipopolysaccharide export system permease protein